MRNLHISIRGLASEPTKMSERLIPGIRNENWHMKRKVYGGKFHILKEIQCSSNEPLSSIANVK